MTFAEKLLSMRKKQGMSQEELAEKLEVSRQAVSRWEQGSAMPDMINLSKISKLFGVTADYLINDEIESDREVPIVKKTESDMKKRGREIGFRILVCLQFFGMFWQIIGYATSPFYGRGMLWLLGGFGVMLCIIGIFAFEIIFRGLPETPRYRKTFYTVTVWCITFAPITIAVDVASHFIVVPYSFLIIHFGKLAAYFIFNLIATAIIRR
ncbi:MAG: helix-turn-helix transcriptional regulator [Clostridia bacterium]|nr:helix-turn-helix transcriptional regulator [Clostridia bacterium]